MVRQMDVPGNYEDPRQVAWEMYSRAHAEDPAMAEYAAERQSAGIKKDVWGQSDPGTRNLRQHRSSWR